MHDTVAAADETGVDADRDREPLVRPPGDGRAVRGPAGTRHAVGVRQAARVRQRRVAPVARRERRRGARRADDSARADRARGPRSRGQRFRARAHAPSRARRPSIREKRATFSLAPGPAAAAAASKRAVRDLYLAGDWIDTGLPGTIESAVRQRTSAPRCSIIVVAIRSMKIAIDRSLSGDRPQGEQPAVVRRPAGAEHPRRRSSDLDVRESGSLMGRIELVLGPAADWRRIKRPAGERLRRRELRARGARAARRRGDRRGRSSTTSIADDPPSFRVSARRADKRFPLTSPQIEREVGGTDQGGARLARRSRQSRS